MLSTLVLSLAISQVPDAPRQITTLPNGIVLCAEEMPQASGFALILYVSTLGHPETAELYGQRHLLEHIVAKGQNRDIDAKLEVRGLSLTAETFRDGISFEIVGPPDEFGMAVAMIREFLEPPQVSANEIEKELKIIDQESALRSTGSRLSASLWSVAFAGQDTDPYGDKVGLESATEETLQAIHADLFRSTSLTVVATGQITADQAVKIMQTEFLQTPKSEYKQQFSRTRSEERKRGLAADCKGSARAPVVPSLTSRPTIAALMASLAIQIETEGAQTVYTPSPNNGLVVLTHLRPGGLAGIDRVIKSDGARLYRTGRAAYQSWLSGFDNDPKLKARLYAQMLLVERGFNINDLRILAGRISQAEFIRALNGFNSKTAFTTRGERG